MRRKALLLALLIIFTSLSSGISYGEGDYNEKLKENILKAKELFNISDAYDKFTSNVNSYDDNTVFYLNWRDSGEELNNISITMDIDGNIVSFDSYPNDYKQTKTKLPKYSKEEAAGIAMKFIKRVSPDIGAITISPDIYPDNLKDEFYNFNYVRIVNEIKYKENSINISVNKNTGQVFNYYINWDRDIEFPPSDKIIKLDQAKALFNEKIGLKAVYKSNRWNYRPMDIDEDEELQHYLAFTIIDTNKGIDAITGEKINTNYYGPYYDGMGADESVEGGISPEEQEAIEELKDLMSENQALETARSILKIDDSYKVESQNLYRNYKNPKDYVWNIYFINNKDNSSISIGIDAKRGELLSFYKYTDHSNDEKNTLNEKESLKLANDYLKLEIPEKINKIEMIDDINNYMDPNMEPRIYNFNYIRKEEDIYVENDMIYIGVDAVSGEVVSYSIDWYKGEFPSKEGMISIEKAYEILWKEIDLDLVYIKSEDHRPKQETQINRDSKIRLVYALNPDKPAIIDARSGELLDYSGKAYKEVLAIEYDDLENTYAKDMIMTLAEYGIGFEGQAFLPKDKITQSDYIYLLWKSINQHRTDKPDGGEMYDYFIRSGYMMEGEKNPEGLVSKLEAVTYIIRIMNLEEVAEIKGIYKDIFLDSQNIVEEAKGYINLAYGLKIIQGNGTASINPDYNLRREDAASVIYKYIFR